MVDVGGIKVKEVNPEVKKKKMGNGSTDLTS